MEENKYYRLVIGLMVVGITLIIIGIIYQIIEITVQNQCYQLQPNDFYSSTICEKYWNNTDWNFIKQWKNN